MKTPGFEIVTLKTGVKSIRDISSGEVFHPIGPMVEARLLHAEQQRLSERCAEAGKFVIWDVGLGGAANAIAALEALKDTKAEVELHSFDHLRSPTEFALENAAELEYVLPWKDVLNELLEKGEVRVSERIRWVYHLGDFRETMNEAPKADAVFYDPYSSPSNQEVWTLNHLSRMRNLLHEGCTLTNYSASSAVRVTWLLAGFYIGRGVGVGKKTETLFASPSPNVVPKPLDHEWLLKMPRSQSSAPIRETVLVPAPIGPEDYARLSRHPQFHA